jgi:hypothetical protein
VRVFWPTLRDNLTNVSLDGTLADCHDLAQLDQEETFVQLVDGQIISRVCWVIVLAAG